MIHVQCILENIHSVKLFGTREKYMYITNSHVRMCHKFPTKNYCTNSIVSTICGRVVRTKSKIIYSVDVLVHMSPALNGSSVSQHFEHSNMVEIHNLDSKYTELSEH